MFNGETPEPDLSLVTLPEPTTEVLSAAEILAKNIRPQGSDWRPAVDGFDEAGRPAPNSDGKPVPNDVPAPSMSEVSSGAVATTENVEFVEMAEVIQQLSPELVGCGG